MQAMHDDTDAVERLRASGLAAFTYSLDVEANPMGVANALLRELPHAGFDNGIDLPPAYLLRSPIAQADYGFGVRG